MSEKFRIPEIPTITPEIEARNRAYRDISDEIKRIGATSADIARAVMIAHGEPIEGTIREEIFFLGEKIKEAIQRGLTLDLIEDLVDDAYDEEHIEESLEDTLDFFGFSDEQCDMVMDIFREKKIGVLVVYDRASRKELGKTTFTDEDVEDQAKVKWKLISLLGAHDPDSVDLIFSETV